MPIPRSFWESVGNPKEFLMSYPRSGSRWFRLLLADVSNRRLQFDTKPLYESQLSREFTNQYRLIEGVSLEEVSPNVHSMTETKKKPLSDRVRPVYRSHNLSQLRNIENTRILYLFRRPLNVLISYFHHAQEKGFTRDVEVGVDAFCLYRIDEWVRHVQEAINLFRASPGRILLLRYLDEAAFDASQIHAALSFLDWATPPAMIQSADADFHRFLQQLNESKQFPYRRGGNANELNFLSESALEEISSRTEDVFSEASTIADSQLAG